LDHRSVPFQGEKTHYDNEHKQQSIFLSNQVINSFDLSRPLLIVRWLLWRSRMEYHRAESRLFGRTTHVKIGLYRGTRTEKQTTVLLKDNLDIPLAE
jgi:hypothetical protein